MIDNLPLYDKLIIQKKNGEVEIIKLDEIRNITYGSALTDALYPEDNAVDLGLSVKWAPVNLGAEDEYDGGSVFSWAGITEQGTDMFGKFDKEAYDKESNEFNINNRSICGTDHDAARVNWGGAWRMPTEKEISELLTQCEWIFDCKKKQVTVIGPNKNEIAFSFNHKEYYYGTHYNGDIWCGELNSKGKSIALSFGQAIVSTQNINETHKNATIFRRDVLLHIRAVLPITQ